MKNIRKFEMIADKNAAVIEEYSVSYVNEINKVYTTPENGEQNDADYSTMYTTFEALEDGTFSFKKIGIGDDIQYSKDNGATWIPLASGKTVSVITGDKVMWKSTIAPSTTSPYGIGEFSSSNKFNVYGNAMSLLFGDDFNGQTSLEGKDYSCYRLFSGCTQLIDVSNLILPATTLADSCYYYMFKGCTSLTTAPELPATTIDFGCYRSMFEGCTNLTTAPSILPATTLVKSCYIDMFSGCTSLTTTPELPATTLEDFCYNGMFQGCTSLTTAPELPSTTLAYNCYGSMFEGCTGLTTAPELPATTLTDSCYSGMFEGCTGLTTAPELPATTLTKGCYNNMFCGCENLTTAPALPATTLAEHCYIGMFRDCTGLTTVPELPAATLVTECYKYMFIGCTSLTTAPELPATTLADKCYYGMFEGCTGLTTAPSILPATTLANECYCVMFSGCTSLTTAPVLPATTLTDSCYAKMFYDCTSLNRITMLATNISASGCLYYWVVRVSSAGTFVKDPDMDSLPTGVSGIPNGWEVKNPITPTECTSLTITANNVRGNDTTTTIHYTATCSGVDYNGNTVTGIVKEGTAVSAEFPQNTSETETVERTITFEFMGVTASTTITQGVWVHQSYTIDLNNQWELSSTISNPDSTLYDGVYQSFSNKGVDKSAAIMYIDIVGYTSFKFYVRSYAESNYDYLVVSNLDSTLTSGTTSGSEVKMTTKGNQNSGTSINNYTLVEFAGIDGNAHRITVMYRKDSTDSSGDDRGYVLIPKNQ